MSLISHNLQAVHEAIAHAARRYDRNPTEIALLAVSKTFSVDAIYEAWQAGQVRFGENYVQEALDKINRLPALIADADKSNQISQQIEWHFIGPIQSNKTRPIAENFAWVHSVERDKIALRLSEQRPAHLPDLQICLQVNVSGEASKSGVTPAQLPALAHYVASLPRLTLRGLMAVPEASDDVAQQRAAFRQLAQLQKELCEQGLELDTLSMGMSGDMDAAIAEGSTLVRIGSAIFGKRNYAV